MMEANRKKPHPTTKCDANRLSRSFPTILEKFCQFRQNTGLLIGDYANCRFIPEVPDLTSLATVGACVVFSRGWCAQAHRTS